MSIKKQYTELYDFLEANKGKKISTVMDVIEDMCSTKKANKAFKTDDAGNVTEVYCYYHKVWESLEDHEYGTKKHSASGVNSMCKVGVNQWTKQQRDAKKAKEQLLLDVAAGTIDPTELIRKMDEIEDKRLEIAA